MQDENETFLNFLKRTDDLAAHLGENVEYLIDYVGISRASLFSYRTGKRKVSHKAWSKLEAAERKAGVSKNETKPHPTQEEYARVREELEEVRAQNTPPDMQKVIQDTMAQVMEDVIQDTMKEMMSEMLQPLIRENAELKARLDQQSAKHEPHSDELSQTG